MPTTALLVIDVQTALFQPSPRPWDADAVLARIEQLALHARAALQPVIWVHHHNASNLPQGGAGWQLAAPLQALPGDYHVDKHTPDAFGHTPLHPLLAALGVAHVVIAGYASEFCIDTSVRRAAALGYAVTLAADAHTTHDKPHALASAIQAHENATLPAIRSFGVPIQALDTAALCQRLHTDTLAFPPQAADPAMLAT